MLTITVPGFELFNSETDEFIVFPDTTLKLEHSLVSVSKWESKWHKRFLDATVEKTNEELIDYIKCMTLTQNVNPEIYNHLSPAVVSQINDYIEDPMTATTFSGRQTGPAQRALSAEVIYYWMIALGIPFECQKWHLNKLMTLIRVCNEKSNPKKMSKSDIYRQNSELNAIRRAAMKSKG